MVDPKTVRNILESYSHHGGINHLDGKNLPSRETVAEIAKDLLRVIFPGFYDRSEMHSGQAKFFVSQMLTSISERLRHEIQKSREYLPGKAEGTPSMDSPSSRAGSGQGKKREEGRTERGNTASEAKEITHQFLENLPEVRRLLATDVEAAFEGDPAAVGHEEVILAYPGLEAIAIQRMAHLLYEAKVILIPRMMTEWAHSRTGIDIHPGARIGHHFFIDHGTGVVIGETTVIGSRVKIYQGVSLGAKSFQKDVHGKAVKGIKRHPNVEDDVTIYANATILGGDTTLGAGSTIAANVFLTQSIPPHSLVFFEKEELKIVPKKSAPVTGDQDFEI